jgi:Putative amidoligase enzyme
VFAGKMNLEDTVSEHIDCQNAALNNPDAYGIEVELEGQNITNPPEAVMTYWKQHKDGSLRVLKPGDECIEYVTTQPFVLGLAEKAVAALFDYLTSPGVKVYDSYRTSIHVHVNFATETFRTIYNFMALCLILDELLVSQNGEHRIGNNFCLRAKDAMGQVMGLIYSINHGNNFFHINHSERYSSINFASLLKFGSIEFRSLECTTHYGRLMHWIGTLAAMKEKAKTYKNPVDVIQQFSAMGPRAFLTSVLGTYAGKYLDVTNMEDMLFNGMRIAQDFAYCSEWNEGSVKDIEAEKKALKAKIMAGEQW